MSQRISSSLYLLLSQDGQYIKSDNGLNARVPFLCPLIFMDNYLKNCHSPDWKFTHIYGLWMFYGIAQGVEILEASKSSLSFPFRYHSAKFN